MRNPSTTSAAGLASILPDMPAGSLALAAAVAATAVAAIDAVPHPDAELLRLAIDVDACARRANRLSQMEEAAMDLFQEPPIPEVLFWRMSDLTGAGMVLTHFDTREIDGCKRNVYISPYTMRELRKELAKHEAYGQHDARGLERTARLGEIIATGEAWGREREAAYEAAGIGDLERANKQEWKMLGDLARRVAAIPASTPEGVLAKLRAITGRGHWCVGHTTTLPQAIKAEDVDANDLDELLLLSVLIDAARLTSAEPIAISEAAA